ncbi:hypothetical protein E2562_021586 [Oryza meyeriana var. granulata]|uniref:F-box associated beta-propeller type 3 domain-containing protein n=1 Tax=Oryza meyeriana var. granulata TaxID=110450 RepID=A0A6G1EXW4_9ORYZ|nr:hypothetical protein E2562_021586 [Oryza meyeriana var. granulata]
MLSHNGNGDASAPHPSDETTLPAKLRSWVATPFGHLSRALAAVFPLSLALYRPSLADGDLPIKLFFTPAAACRNDSFFYTWHPSGQIKKLPYSPGAFPEGTLVSPVTNPLHGLVLLRCWPPPSASLGYFVCNPCTGAVLPLPDSSSPMKMSGRRQILSSRFNYVRYGLGYSSTAKKYKVVRLFCLVDDDGAAAVPTSCENGSLHFLCEDSSIVTFNVCDETFGSLSPPPGLQFGLLKLTVLEGACASTTTPRLSTAPAASPTVSGCSETTARRGALGADLPHRRRGVASRHAPGGSLLAEAARSAPRREREKAGGFVRLDQRPQGVRRASCRPKVVFSPHKTIIGDYARGHSHLVVLLDESGAATPVGRTSEELAFSSPSSKAWSEILKALPARQVARLRLVCRDVRAMIETDRFAALHAVNANLNKSPRIMFVKRCSYFGGTFVSLEKFLGTSKMPPPLTNGDSKIVCSMPCHGLNVGTYGRGDFVCNPATGFYERIEREDDGAACSISLGYDLVANKHVLVRLRRSTERSLECLVRYIDDRFWYKADAPPRRPVADDDDNVPPAVYAGGKLYWVARSDAEPEGSPSPTFAILAFDVGTGSFDVLRGPPSGNGGGGGERVTILELSGALCIARTNLSTNVMEVWTMKSKGGAWLMKHRVELGRFSPEYSPEDTTALAVDPRDGRIFLSTGRTLGVYDPMTAAMETIYSLESGDGIDKRFTPILYHESLVYPFKQSDGYHAKKSWSARIQRVV